MIDLRINKEGLKHNIEKAKENHIIIPTIAQMQNPDLIPEKIKEKLTHTGLWDVDPVNLFRISWHNEAKEFGGLYQHTPNYVEIPSSLSGVPCRILAMSGKGFPTGCHKVARGEPLAGHGKDAARHAGQAAGLRLRRHPAAGYVQGAL